jgi:hypothetical protein
VRIPHRRRRDAGRKSCRTRKDRRVGIWAETNNAEIAYTPTQFFLVNGTEKTRRGFAGSLQLRRTSAPSSLYEAGER